MKFETLPYSALSLFGPIFKLGRISSVIFVETISHTMANVNGSASSSSYLNNGGKRFKLTDIDEETLNSGAEG